MGRGSARAVAVTAAWRIIKLPIRQDVPARMARVDDDRRLSFGDDAERYDRARPSYPAAAVDAAMDGANIRRVLDVGCGTGIASQLFLDRGCEVVGVEPDERMAAVAHRRGVNVVVTPFETWTRARRSVRPRRLRSGVALG